MRQRIFTLVGPARDGDYASRAYDIFIVFVAVLSLVPMLFDATKIDEFQTRALWVLDVVTAYFLLFDYILRWITHDIKTGKGWKAFVAYPFTPMAIIDILAILPTLNLVPQALRFLRILRIVKVFRYSKNLLVVTNACYREARTLGSVFIAVTVYMFTVALIMFNCEPESFDGYFDALCWACTSMTSVAFSDSRPVGFVGQVLSIVSSLVALLVVALPAGVITGAYINEVKESKKAGSRYFTMTKRRFWRPGSSQFWKKENKRMRRRMAVLVVCIAAGLLVFLVLVKLDSPIRLPSFGTALAAFLLEPAAGIVVAFISAIVATLLQSDTASMLLFFSYSIVALCYGAMLPWAKSGRKAWRFVAFVAILIVGCAIVNAAAYLARAHGDVDTAVTYLIDSNFVSVEKLLGLEASPILAVLVGSLIDSTKETLAVLIVVTIASKLLGSRAESFREEREPQGAAEQTLGRLGGEEAHRAEREAVERRYAEVLGQQQKLAEERERLERQLADLK